MPQQGGRLFVADIDGTMFRSSLTLEMVNALRWNRVLPKSDDPELNFEYAAWLDGEGLADLGSYEIFVQRIASYLHEALPGVERSRVTGIVQSLILRHRNRCYRFPTSLLRYCQREGFVTVALSGSPEVAVEAFRQAWGIDYAIGSVLEVDASDRYTGTILWRHKDKHEFLGSLVSERGLSLKGSIGIGDTANDISFLDLVDTPVAFNPDLDLLQHATARGWLVVVERKNTILSPVSGTSTDAIMKKLIRPPRH